MKIEKITMVMLVLIIGCLLFWNFGMQQQIYALEKTQDGIMEYQNNTNNANLEIQNIQSEINKIFDERIINIIENNQARDIVLTWLAELHEEEFYNETGKHFNEIVVEE